MPKNQSQEQVRGRTLRFSWLDGPTKGSIHEHTFHDDGTVEWHAVGGATTQKPAAERPRYYSVEVTDDFWLVSYLSDSGFTLTVVLNFEDRSLVGIASNDKTWIPVHGHFEPVN